MMRLTEVRAKNYRRREDEALLYHCPNGLHQSRSLAAGAGRSSENTVALPSQEYAMRNWASPTVPKPAACTFKHNKTNNF
jgi:hypothetical protein